MAETYLQKQDAIDNNHQVTNIQVNNERNDFSYLKYLTYKGATKRYGMITNELKDQLDYELRVINDLGFNSYFLIVWDLIKTARERNIPIGPGRGSVGGSRIAYALGITQFDPIEYDLIFERFLNPERPEMPDIDIDVSQKHRQQLIQLVIDKYGEDHVAQIITYGTLMRRSLIEEVGKVFRIGWDSIDTIKKLLPEDEENDDSTLSELLEERPKLQDYMNEVVARYPQYLETCLTLEGLHRNESKHAGGIIVCDTPLAELVPLFAKGKKDAAENDNAHPAIQLDMKDAEKVGLLKIDLLGLRTMTVVYEAQDNIRKFNPDFDIEDLHPYNDPEVYKMLRSGRTKSVFQLEGTGITHILKQMNISNFDDLVALLALYRPGCLDAKMHITYINRKLGTEQVSYLLPELEQVLGDTYGVILYQEQVMRMAMVLAGYTAAEADKLRKAMGKKDKELMAKEMDKFKTLAIAKGFDANIIGECANQIETFARYGFNKSHSVAYAINTYYTAYLKRYYPLEYMTAELNSFLSKSDKLASVISEVKIMGLPLLPPDINHSQYGFSVDHFAIRFGLSGIKGVGDKTVNAIITERDKYGDFIGLDNFCDRIAPKECNVAAKRILILAGAFDEFGDRAYMHHSVSCRYDKKYKVTDDQIHMMTVEDKMANEKQLLNFFVSGTPFSTSMPQIQRFGATLNFSPMADYSKGIAGILKDWHKLKTKKKQQEMAFLTVETESGVFSVTAFSDEWSRFNNLIEGSRGKMVVIHGAYNSYHGKEGIIMDDIAVIDRYNVVCNSMILNLGTNPGFMQLAAIRHEIECSPGNTEVTIIVNTGNEDVEILTECRVSVTKALVEAIDTIMGFNAVSYGW